MIFAEAAQAVKLYDFSLDIIYAIPLVYFLALFVCVLLREFVNGPLRYVLAGLFMLSYAFLWVTLMLDKNPWQFILPIVVVFGCVSGLSRGVRAVLKDLKKL